MKKLHIWEHIQTLQLHFNHHVQSLQNIQNSNYADYIPEIGNGLIPRVSELGQFKIKLEQEQCQTNTSLTDLRQFVFESYLSNSITSCQAKVAIIAPTNEAVEEINSMMMTSFPGIEKKYKSCDTVNNERLYPVEFLNKLTPSGFPTHIINVEVGSPIMLLWNLDPQYEHCNGTRYIVVSGSNVGRTISIPRITHVTQENEYQFEMRRKQFPIKPAFACHSQKQSRSNI